MRYIRASVMALVLVLAVAACGTDATEPDETVTGSPAGQGEGAAGGPTTGGQIVVALSSDPGHLNPAITTSGATHTASELLFNGLVELDENLEPVPGLAERWDIEEDGAVYRFHLREGVVWHDGEPFTSADVKFSFEEALLELHSRTAASVGNALESIETPDENTVVFRFAHPYAPLLQQLNVTEAPIIPQHVYGDGQEIAEHPANTEPIGTGPFRFVSYSPDAEIVLERNDNYFKEDLPHLDRVVMRVIPDAGSQVVALEAGEVDWLWGVPGPDQRRLEASGDVEFLRTPVNPGGANCIMTLSYNLERPMFADVNVRRAIAHGLDREQFLDRVLFGEGAVAQAPISSGIPFAHAEDVELPTHDVGEAERLLEEAGWVREGDGVRVARGVEGVEDGTPLAFDFVHFPTFSQYGELLRAQLQEIGADVELRAFEPPVFVETVFTQRDFDTNIVSYCNATDPEIGVRRMYISSNIGPIPFSNAAAYRNEVVDRLFDQALRTVDTEERSGIYREIQQIVVEDLPYFWIVETMATRAHTAECEGFRADGHFAESAHCDR